MQKKNTGCKFSKKVHEGKNKSERVCRLNVYTRFKLGSEKLEEITKSSDSKIWANHKHSLCALLAS